MPKKKTTILSESKIDNLFIINAGFNLTDAETGAETRFEKGTDQKPHFVTEQDFTSANWRELKQMKAIVLFEKPETDAEKEKIIFEEIGD